MFLSSSRCFFFLLVVFSSAYPCFACTRFHVISTVIKGPVANGRVCIDVLDTCVCSDDSGYIAVEFSVPDSAVFTFSALGYQDTILREAAADTVTVAMMPFEVNDRSMEIVVTAPSANRDEGSYRQSEVFFTPNDIKTKAGAANDLGRYIGSLPSAVSSLSENYDNTFFVRGGRPSENIFLVDGIEMENIDHFSQANGSGGPIGFINAENVRTVQFNAGNMSVHYPSKMSSVVDIGMRNGSLNEMKYKVGGELTGGIGGVASFEGPLVNGKSSYVFSGRYIDFEPLHKSLEKILKDAGISGIPKFGDFYGKVFLSAGDNFDLSATGILSYNKYGYSLPAGGFTDNLVFFWDSLNHNERIFQGGTGISAQYTNGALTHEVHASFSFRNGVTADSLSSFSDTFFTRRYAVNPINTDKDYRERYMVSAKSALALREHDTLSAGVRASKNDYQFSRSDESRYQGDCIICDGNGNPDTVTVTKSTVASAASVDNTEYGASVDYKNTWGMLRSTLGLRGDYFRLLNDFVVSPRLSFSLKPERAFGVFTGSLGLYHQFPTELPFQVFDFYYWVYPNTPGDTLQQTERRLLRQAQPERCWQASVGYDKFLWGSTEARAETYYKWYDRDYHYLVPGYQETFYWDNQGKLELQKQDGKRRVYGVELSLGNRNYKGFFYSLGGSLFDVKNRYNDGKWYDDWTDVRYTYSLAFGACFFNDHILSLSVQGSGGRPYCPQMIALDCIKRPYAVYDPDASYYSGRLDKLVSTNMRYSFTKRIGRFRIESFAEMINLLNYKPTLEYQFNGVGFIEIKPFGFTPVIGFNVQW